jgi:hypothetical protein
VKYLQKSKQSKAKQSKNTSFLQWIFMLSYKGVKGINEKN